MKILLFTAASRRHHALAHHLAQLGEVDVVGEVPPERVPQGPAMAEYYRRMDKAEAEVFADAPYGLLWLPGCQLIYAGNMGAASEWNGDVEPYDKIVTYGCSWLRPPLVDRLIAKGAINLHAGAAPYYRGTASNFWALYDGHPEYVGFTVHQLSSGIDSGPILCFGRYFLSALAPMPDDPFLYTMNAVYQGFQALVTELAQPSEPKLQNAAKLIRYSRAADFTEAVCAEYLARLGVSV